MTEVQRLQHQLAVTTQELQQTQQREQALKNDLNLIRQQIQAKPKYEQSVPDLMHLLKLAEADNRNLQMKVQNLESEVATHKQAPAVSDSRRSSASVERADTSKAQALPRAQPAKKQTASFKEASEQRSASSSRRGSHQSDGTSPLQPVAPAARGKPTLPKNEPSMADVLGPRASMRMGEKADMSAGSSIRLEGQVVQAHNLPKVDRMGSIDAYVEIRFGKDSHKTKYKKNNYDPVWGEEFGPMSGTISDDLEIVLWDWNRMSEDKRVGLKKLGAAELAGLAGAGQKEMLVRLDGDNGHPLLGHSGKHAEVLLKLRTEIQAAGGAGAQTSLGVGGAAARGAGGARGPDGEQLSVPFESLKGVAGSLDVTVTQLSHLPRMDALLKGGKCDPYVVVQLGKEEAVQTPHKLNTFDCTWEDDGPLALNVPPIKDKSDLVLKLCVYDWDRVGKNELIGEASVALDLCHPEQDTKRNFDNLALRNEHGKEVIGNDKHATKMSIRVEWSPAHPITRPLPSSAVRPRNSTVFVEFQVHSCTQLPKTDVFGKCDPYVELQCGTRTYRTSIRFKTFDPRWVHGPGETDKEETFLLEIPENVDMLYLRVWDWDRSNANDLVGGVDIHVDRLLEFTSDAKTSGSDADAAMSPTISLDLSKDGKRLRGHSKGFSKVQVSSRAYVWAVPDRLPDRMQGDIGVLRSALRQKEYYLRVKLAHVDSPPHEFRPLTSSCFFEMGIQNEAGQVLGEAERSEDSKGVDPHVFNDEVTIKVERTSKKIDELVFFAILLDASSVLAPATAVLGLGGKGEPRGKIFIKLSELLGACTREGGLLHYSGEIPVRKLRGGPILLSAHGYPCMLRAGFTIELPAAVDHHVRSMVEETHLESENILKQLEELDAKAERMLDRHRLAVQFSAEKTMRLSDLSAQLNQIKAQHKHVDPPEPQAGVNEVDTTHAVQELESKIERNLQDMWAGGMLGDQKEILVGIAVTLVHVLFFRVFIG